MHRNRFADVLKGILILFVIILHSDISYSIRVRAGFPFWASMAVPAFMLISGYVSAISMEKLGDHGVEKAYEPRQLRRKLLRFVIPFGIAFVAEWIIFRVAGLYLVGPREYGLFALLLDFIRGGKGQGSYYFPIMIQFVFVFPAIYYVIKKYNFKGLMTCFVANGIYEIIKIAFGMADYEYRFLLFRYLFIIAAGCYIAVGKWREMKKRTLLSLSLVSVILGLGFTYLFSYTNYVPKVIIFWKETSFAACLYLIPLFAWMLTRVHFTCKPLEYIGKASFNVFLVQMVYFNFENQIEEKIPSLELRVLVGILFCVCIGVGFYAIENRLTKKIIDRERNHHEKA